MKTLHLTLKKKWFHLILTGAKKTEYREMKPQWICRLFDKDGYPRSYDQIKFINGYGNHRPWMTVEFKGLTNAYMIPPENGEEGLYDDDFAIRLGDVLESGNLEKLDA